MIYFSSRLADQVGDCPKRSRKNSVSPNVIDFLDVVLHMELRDVFGFVSVRSFTMTAYNFGGVYNERIES